MDFSSLDLLASTALRDNSQSQSDSTTTPVADPHNNHDNTIGGDEDDDDDESDGKLAAVATENCEVLPGLKSEEQLTMGSVKCGKHKKTVSKPIVKSIFVRDGRCVAKKVAPPGVILSDKNNGEREGIGCTDVLVSESILTKEEEEEVCVNNSSSPANNVALPRLEEEISEEPKCKSETDVHLKNRLAGFVDSVLTNCESKDSVDQDVNAVHLETEGNRSIEAASLNDSQVTEQLDSRVTTVKEVPSDVKVTETGCDHEVGISACGSQSSATASDLRITSAVDGPLVTSVIAVPSDTQVSSKAECDLQQCKTEQDTCEVGPSAKSGAQTSHGGVKEHAEKGGKGRTLDTSLFSGEVETNSSSTNTPLDVGQVEQNQTLSAQKETEAVSEAVIQAQLDNSVNKEIEAVIEADRCDNCDENSAGLSVPTSTDTSSSFPHSPFNTSSPLAPTPAAETAVDVGGNKSFSKDILDQDLGSSGNKDIQPSTSSLDTVQSLPPPPLLSTAETAYFLDHCYCKISGQSVDNTDDSGDAFESADENVSADDIEHRPRSLSVDSEYLQYGVPPLPSQLEGLQQTEKTSLLSPTLSVDSVSNDSSLSDHSNAAGGQFYSILAGSQSTGKTNLQQKLSMLDSPSHTVDSVTAATDSSKLSASFLDSSGLVAGGNKCARYRIGTFGSFSNSHLDLDTERKKNKLKIGIPPQSVMKTSMSSPALASPSSPFPLMQSPGMEWDRSDAGSEAPDDLDSSTTELSSSHDSVVFGANTSQVWHHPVFHDHDYCCKEVSEKLGKPIGATTPTKGGKRRKKKDGLESEEETTLKKGKYLKRELLKQDNRFSLMGGGGAGNRSSTVRSSLLAESLMTKPNPVGRPRKRFEKQQEEYDSETGTKMKITGKYQDQYVYYYSKTSRNRRRKFEDKVPSGDKIIVPPPKPGDIIIPHLTDADCEAIRRGGRSAFRNAGAFFSPAQLASVQLPHSDNGDMMDSSIVNTILSMESDNLASPLSSHDGDGDLDGIAGNLTNEQVDLLLDCLKDVEVPSTSQHLDFLTSAETVSMASAALDSLTATTVEEDFLVPGVPLDKSSADSSTIPNSAALHSETEVKMEVIDSPEVKQEADASPMSFIKQEVEEKDIKTEEGDSLPLPASSHHSVEKNLEFLKNPDIKTDFYHPVSSVPSTVASSDFAPAASQAQAATSSEVNHETPWIVTVTLYWNDIPAIIINNTPHVRLVDIHRQILPAKDTGILKKRCQLMNIQVSNCSEMQRYFLVQYGRAHNSKSTLVITKDEAWRLISYYAHPQPRNLRGEEGAGLRRSSSYAELRSFMASPSNPVRHAAPSPAFAHPRRRGGFRRRATPTRSHNPSPEPAVAPVTPRSLEQPPPSPLPAEPASPSKRLRHKKINFLEMLKGEDSSQASSPVVEGGVADDYLATLDEGTAAKNSSTKAATSTNLNKRRNFRELGDGGLSNGGRRGRRKKEDTRKVSSSITLHQTPEPEISVDEDSPETSAINMKNKKRSPGSSAAVSLSASSRSPKSKFGLIKVNVKSLVNSGQSTSPTSNQPKKKHLFGRKASSTDVEVDVAEVAAVGPLRVLRISHQEADTNATSVSRQILSPVAEMHLDLYKRALSPCVRCGTCDKFLSVPGFLKHQHLNGADSSQDVVSIQKPRVLVPMNKENISEEEQHLWNEFVALQERLDHSVTTSSMGAYSLSSVWPTASSLASQLLPKPASLTPKLSPTPTSLASQLLPAPASLSSSLSPAGTSLASPLDVVCAGAAAAPEGTKETGTEVVPQHDHSGLGRVHSGLDSSVAHPENISDLGATAVTSPDDGTYSGSCTANAVPAETGVDSWEPQISVCSPPPLSLSLPTTHTETEEKLDSVIVNKTVIHSHSLKKGVSAKKQQKSRRIDPSANIRTSSRKRKKKQFYDFESYEFSRGNKKGSRIEADAQDTEVDVTGTMVDDNININGVVLNTGPLHFIPGTPLHESKNV